MGAAGGANPERRLVAGGDYAWGRGRATSVQEISFKLPRGAQGGNRPGGAIRASLGPGRAGMFSKFPASCSGVEERGDGNRRNGRLRGHGGLCGGGAGRRRAGNASGPFKGRTVFGAQLQLQHSNGVATAAGVKPLAPNYPFSPRPQAT